MFDNDEVDAVMEAAIKQCQATNKPVQFESFEVEDGKKRYNLYEASCAFGTWWIKCLAVGEWQDIQP